MSANRGKYAEGKVKGFLQKQSELSSLCYWRLPDAHAGSMTPTLADFLLLSNASMHLWEIKETQYADRLPYGNFKVENVARMTMWENAGAKCLVIVYHTSSKCYRILPLEFFRFRPLKTPSGKPIGSWNFLGMPTSKLEDLINYL